MVIIIGVLLGARVYIEIAVGAPWSAVLTHTGDAGWGFPARVPVTPSSVTLSLLVATREGSCCTRSQVLSQEVASWRMAAVCHGAGSRLRCAPRSLAQESG